MCFSFLYSTIFHFIFIGLEETKHGQTQNEYFISAQANFNKTKNNDYDESGNRHKGHEANKKKEDLLSFWSYFVSRG